MAVDIKHYAGREPAFVKHKFIEDYLPALIGRVCSPKSRFTEFVYVDVFAGPWKSVGKYYEDTSFGIALDRMTSLRLTYLGKGHDIKMKAFLVEKDVESFAQLEQVATRFPKIEIVTLPGVMEDHVAKIAASIPSTAFSFTLIDPKGFPDISALMPLLKRQNAEVFVNFMFDFANRFAGTGLIPALEAWLSALGNEEWREQVKGLSGSEREQSLDRLASEGLRVTGRYNYAPVITVDKPRHDRPLYKLIFLSRHPKGLEVFRDSEAKALGAQAQVRSATKAKRRAEDSMNGELFADGSDAVPNDRSSQRIKWSQEQAATELANRLIAAGAEGMTWGDLWPRILEDFSVTRSWLGRQVNDRRKSGQLLAPGWPNERKQIPDDDQCLIWSDQGS